MPALLALLALLWPLPCADAGTCWLAWDPAARAQTYEIALDGVRCATIWQTVHPITRRVNAPRTVLWPAPGRCLPTTTGALTVRACNAAGCSPWSAPVEWQHVAFRCWAGAREVNCR